MGSEATESCDESVNIPSCYIENVDNSVLDDLPEYSRLLNSVSNNDAMDELADCVFPELYIVDISFANEHFDTGESEGEIMVVT
jgi:hypothetical protein